MISFGIIHTDALSHNRSDYVWGIPLLNEITGTYSAFLLLPFLFLVWNRFPLTKTSWLKRLPLYLAVTLATGFMHTSLMMVSRDLLYPVFRLGDHDVGLLVYRYLMEFQKQVFWIWGTFGFLALARHLRRYHENELRSVKLQEQLVQSRLDVMRQQINPHFLFNSLNLISNKVYESPEETDRLITELADLLRLSLEMGKSPKVSFNQELQFLEKYIHIMQERFGDRFTFSKKIEPDCLDMQVPSLILQPIIENSFKHRLEVDASELTIDLIATQSDGKLTIQVTDESSKGKLAVGDRSTSSENGVGLNNIRERLNTLYQQDASLNFGPVGDRQFQVTLVIPYIPSSPE